MDDSRSFDGSHIWMFLSFLRVHNLQFCTLQLIQMQYKKFKIDVAAFRFLEDLEEGVYIQQTLESVLLNMDGKQLLVS